MPAGRTLCSYSSRVALLLCLLLVNESWSLAALKPRASLRLASHGGTPRVQQVGKASWYGAKQQGKKTASGARFDQRQLTAAHRTLPLGTSAKVTNLETGQAVQVEITDRGPHAKGRIIDLSRAAAQRIGLKKDGTARVRVEASPLLSRSPTALASHRHAHKAEKRST
jgi:peptidoglycan lytic transglycosylase